MNSKEEPPATRDWTLSEHDELHAAPDVVHGPP
jgi:hypothetical protein